MNLFKSISLLALMGLSACSADISTPALPIPSSLTEKPSDSPLSGRVQGRSWSMEAAFGTLTREGNLQVLISEKGDGLNCRNLFFRKVGVAFIIPYKLGTSKFDMLNSSDKYPVTLTFPPQTGTPEYMNIIADKSTITIDAINSKTVTGGLIAKFLDPSYSSSLSGRFEITLCP